MAKKRPNKRKRHPSRSREFYNARGLTKASRDRYEEAIADYNEAIRLQPDFMLAYLSRSATNTMLGREDAARSDYENILQFESPFIEDIDTKDIDTEIIEIIDIKDIEEKE